MPRMDTLTEKRQRTNAGLLLVEHEADIPSCHSDAGIVESSVSVLYRKGDTTGLRRICIMRAAGYVLLLPVVKGSVQ